MVDFASHTGHRFRTYHRQYFFKGLPVDQGTEVICMKRLYKRLINRLTFLLTFLMLQIVLFLALVYFVSSYWQWNLVFISLSVIIVFFLIVQEENPYYRMRWIIPIVIFPVFGGAFYLLYRKRNLPKKDLERHFEIERNRRYYMKDREAALTNREARYLQNHGWASYENTKTEFLDSGQTFFDRLLEDIDHAQSYIFIEFFIIRKGEMWDTLLERLRKKQKEGVDIKIIYDDFGSATFARNYPQKLTEEGIETHIFNPIKLRLNFSGNYRNHRKIVVVDGHIGYSTGSNISDEYIGLKKPLGQWADTGIRLEGEAVWSLTVAFLDVLSFIKNNYVDYDRYRMDEKRPSDGKMIPFADTPLDKEEITKNIYLSLIASAEQSIQITTPYLIIDPEFKNALRYAAKSGVRVEIVIPKIPDKKIVYMVTESHLPALLRSGVEVYRFTPGFMHAKMMVVDGKKALIGSANLDYRSLYLHFENSVYLEHSSAIARMGEYVDIVREMSEAVGLKERRSLHYRFFQLFFRMFAGLM